VAALPPVSCGRGCIGHILLGLALPPRFSSLSILAFDRSPVYWCTSGRARTVPKDCCHRIVYRRTLATVSLSRTGGRLLTSPEYSNTVFSGRTGSFDRFFRKLVGVGTATLAGPMVLLGDRLCFNSSFTVDLNLEL
uniref:Uncharacterized protein n=1 Tax=Ciona intestinalis TaxID=7719 RepID=F6QG41_CIOIN